MNVHLRNMQNAAARLDEKLSAVLAELSKIEKICDIEAPIYKGDRREIEAACARARRALEES